MSFELTPMRTVWAGLSVAGAAAALWGWAAPSASDAVAMAALALWCLTETTLRRNWLALLTLPAMLAGLGLALPLYLFFRSRRIA